MAYRLRKIHNDGFGAASIYANRLVKWTNFRMNPLAPFRPPKKSTKTTDCEAKLRSEGYDRLFVDDGSGAIPPEYEDLWTLVELVQETRPQIVLEYGAGYSSYVIAETLRRLAVGKLISIELDERWQRVARARLPDCANAKIISARPEVRHCPSTGFEAANHWYKSKPRPVAVATIAFPELHDLKPDLIFLDGPGRGQIDCLAHEDFKLIVSDPIFMESTAVICVDGRPAQCAFLSEHLGDRYNHEIRHRQKFTIFRPAKTSTQAD